MTCRGAPGQPLERGVLRVVEHLHERGHQALIIAPGAGPDRYLHAHVRRVRAVQPPVITSLPIGVPSPNGSPSSGPTSVHLASPFVLGAGGLRAARRLGIPPWCTGGGRGVDTTLFYPERAAARARAEEFDRSTSVRSMPAAHH